MRVRGALGHSHAGLAREERPFVRGDGAPPLRALQQRFSRAVNVVQRLRPDAIDPVRPPLCSRPVADASDKVAMMIIMVVVLMASPTP